MPQAKLVLACAILGAAIILNAACSRRAEPRAMTAAGKTPSANLVWESSGDATRPLRRVLDIERAPDGNIWVVEGGIRMEEDSGRFFIFDPAGALLEIWGGPGTEAGKFVLSRGPTNDGADLLFLPDGSFLVADKYNARIQRFDGNREFIGTWGSGDGVASAPVGLAMAADGEVLAIFGNRPEIQRFMPDGSYLGMIQARLKNPMGICVDPSGRIWVADRNYASDQIVDGLVRVFGADGKPLFECGQRQGEFSGLRNPGDLVADDSGRIYLSDNYHHRFVVFSPNGGVIATIGERGSGGLGFNYTNGVALAENGDLFLGDWTGGRIVRAALSDMP